MPTFRYQAIKSDGEEVIGVLTAKDERAARRQLIRQHLFVNKLSLATEDDPSDDESGSLDQPAASPQATLAEFGWLIESLPSGLRLRRSGLWYGSMAGCMTMILVLTTPFVFVAWRITQSFWRSPPDNFLLRSFFLLLPLLNAGAIGLVAVAILVKVLQFAFVREVWDSSRGLLVVRRKLLGFSSSREYRDVALVLEPHFDDQNRQLKWRLALHSDGRKQFLLRPTMLFLSMSTRDSLAECRAIGTLLAESTGWNLTTSDIAVEGLQKPPRESREDELLALLQSRGFRPDETAARGLKLRPPMLGRRLGGLVLLSFGLVWLAILSNGVNSFLQDAEVKQHLWAHIPFWLVMTPLLLVGMTVCWGGVESLFNREHWIADGNLLVVKSGFIRRREEEFVDAIWHIAETQRTDSRGRPQWRRALQLKSDSGQLLKVLYQARDDDIPRVLGQLLARRTGWSIVETGNSTRRRHQSPS